MTFITLCGKKMLLSDFSEPIKIYSTKFVIYDFGVSVSSNPHPS